MEYTKGEWKAKGNRVVIPNKQGFKPTLSNPIFVVAQCSTYCNSDEVEAGANAHLIASAPDLYEACEDYKDTLNTLISVHPDDKILATKMFALVKALAKAEDK